MQIIDHPDFDKYDTSSVKSVAYGGAPAPPSWSRDFAPLSPRAAEQRLRAHRDVGGPRPNSGADYVAKPDSCGPASPSTRWPSYPRSTTARSPATNFPVVLT